eukprot:snap_masked-scaffold_6-processed-gene-9.10-mRNA-1 protein AED:1.00 eAED:1.00 QI:0/-1/0/0/-1/1/1/0/164
MLRARILQEEDQSISGGAVVGILFGGLFGLYLVFFYAAICKNILAENAANRRARAALSNPNLRQSVKEKPFSKKKPTQTEKRTQQDNLKTTERETPLESPVFESSPSPSPAAQVSSETLGTEAEAPENSPANTIQDAQAFTSSKTVVIAFGRDKSHPVEVVPSL